MQILRDAQGLGAFAGGVFVPTMGALHEGHRALIRRARDVAQGRPVVVSVFVNPTQFNDPTDFERYPRTLDADALACRESGADVLFAPGVDDVYPPSSPPASLPPLPEVATTPGLEDAHRPGHFQGVCQVCARLFELVRPSVAIFGEKDWQQLAVVRAMVRGLGLTLDIQGHPTIREPDGVAMSSRNMRLTPNHRRRAVALVRALAEASRHHDPIEAERAGRTVLLTSRIVPEYFVIRDAATLLAPVQGAPARALVAAPVGGVRLIDNAPWPGFSIEATPRQESGDSRS